LVAALNAAKLLGVDPVISAKEMADPDVDHLGVMAYAARLQAIAGNNPRPKTDRVTNGRPPPAAVAQPLRPLVPLSVARGPVPNRGIPVQKRVTQVKNVKVKAPSRQLYTGRRVRYHSIFAFLLFLLFILLIIFLQIFVKQVFLSLITVTYTNNKY